MEFSKKSIDYSSQTIYNKDNQRKGVSIMNEKELIINANNEYGRLLLPGSFRKVSKKQMIINSVLNKARQLAKKPITGKQANTLQRFVSDRLSTHGRNGYMFKMVVDYHKQLIPASDTGSIAMYTLECNHIETI